MTAAVGASAKGEQDLRLVWTAQSEHTHVCARVCEREKCVYFRHCSCRISLHHTGCYCTWYKVAFFHRLLFCVRISRHLLPISFFPAAHVVLRSSIFSIRAVVHITSKKNFSIFSSLAVVWYCFIVGRKVLVFLHRWPLRGGIFSVLAVTWWYLFIFVALLFCSVVRSLRQQLNYRGPRTRLETRNTHHRHRHRYHHRHQQPQKDSEK